MAHFPRREPEPALKILDCSGTQTLNFNKELISQDRARLIVVGAVGFKKVARSGKEGPFAPIEDQ